MTEVETYTATIFIGGDYAQAKARCQRYCYDVGLCVTIEPTEYVYTGGCEAGVRIGFLVQDAARTALKDTSHDD